jgi:hypothetical protein
VALGGVKERAMSVEQSGQQGAGHAPRAASAGPRAQAPAALPSARPEAQRPDGQPSALAEAWVGWIRPLVLLGAAGLLYLGYRYELLPEQVAGAIVLGVALLALALAALLPAWILALDRPPSQRLLVAGAALAWLVCVSWPVAHSVWPGAPLATARLAQGRLVETVDAGRAGPFELTVRGQPRSASGGVEIPYRLTVRGAADTNGAVTLDGIFDRSFHQVRASRRGGTATAVAEHTARVHRVDGVRGSSLTLSIERLDEGLADPGLTVEVRPAGAPPQWPFVFGGVALVLGVVADALLTRGRAKARTYVGLVAGLGLVLAYDLPLEVTPTQVVRPALGSLFLAVVTGGMGASLLSAVARWLVRPQAPPRPKRTIPNV